MKREMGPVLLCGGDSPQKKITSQRPRSRYHPKDFSLKQSSGESILYLLYCVQCRRLQFLPLRLVILRFYPTLSNLAKSSGIEATLFTSAPRRVGVHEES